MKRTIILLTALAALTITGPLFASSDFSDITVTATVSKNCTISTLPVAFGAYDPVVANAATPAGDKTATGSVTVSCTKGSTGLSIDLDNGGHYAGSTRNMNGGTDNLAYSLFQPDGSTAWGAGVGTGGYPVPATTFSTSKAPASFTVNGLLKGAQDVAVGAYTDTVKATINF